MTRSAGRVHQSPLSEYRLALTVRSNMYVPLHRRQVFIRLHRTDPSAVSDPPSPAAVALRNGIVAALEAARQVPIDLVDESDEDMPVNPDTALPWPAAAVSGTVYLCVMCVAIVPVLRSY